MFGDYTFEVTTAFSGGQSQLWYTSVIIISESLETYLRVYSFWTIAVAAQRIMPLKTFSVLLEKKKIYIC